MRKYFGTDGIRGKANAFPMTPDVLIKVGMAVAALFRSDVHRARAVIGKDTRLSGYMVETALVAGLTAGGMDVFLLGPIPTPAIAMLCGSMRADVGIMISASHNPFYDNGLKLFGPDGFKLADSIEQKIEELVDSDLSKVLVSGEKVGRAKRVEGDIYRYIEHAKRTLGGQINLEGLRIVIDCANGAAYKAAPLALWELGAEVIAISDKPNGVNINLECGSTHPATLSKKVKKLGADVGIALDGDGDRVVMVDEEGQVVDGDQLLAVIAQHWLNDGLLRGGGVVATIMSNLGLERFLEEKGLKLVRTPVGDRHVMHFMRQHGFNVGGEQSGHIILSDYGTTGDGLISALQILGCMKKSGKRISELCKCFTPVPQILKNVACKDKNILKDEKVVSLFEKAKSLLGERGRLIIRPSGTEPLLRIMAEGDDQSLIAHMVDTLAEEFTAVIRAQNAA